MNFLKKLFGAAPRQTDDGAFSPSPLALKLATASKTDYDGGPVPKEAASVKACHQPGEF
ncbi:MAG: hypothetical protein QNL63_13795 [Paracoccaceae bacterium]